MRWAESRTARWSAGTVLLCVAIVIASWFLLIAPQRVIQADLRGQDTQTRQSNQSLRIRLEELRVQFAKLPEQRAKLAEIRRQLPATEDLPTLVRAIDSLASSSGVGLISVSPGSPTAVDAGSQPAGGSSSGSAPGLFSIPVSIVVSGDYFQSVAFLRQLQTGMPRAMLVTGLQISQGAAGTNAVQVTITGQVFTQVTAAGALAGAHPVKPSPTPGVTSLALAHPTAGRP